MAAGAGAADVTAIFTTVTPCGGKSLLPAIAPAGLISAGKVERICWILPRDSFRLHAEDAFADAPWRAVLIHLVTIRTTAMWLFPAAG
jgi:hypothetical protein